MFRISIHTLIGLGLIIFISFFAYNNMNKSVKNLNTIDELEAIYENMNEKLSNSSPETKTSIIRTLLDEEKIYYQAFSKLAFSITKIFNSFIFISTYILILQLVFLLAFKITSDINKSAIFHCVAGFFSIFMFSHFYDHENIFQFPEIEYLYIFYVFLGLLLLGVILRYRTAAILLVLYSIYFAYSCFNKNGYIGYQVLLVGLALDSCYSIDKLRLRGIGRGF